ncbi:MAG TPA: DUF2062 domain-containing protein [Nitrospirota bacterium]|nr:DUF2062 domain-containing protein [Nitrospirota bacterium]
MPIKYVRDRIRRIFKLDDSPSQMAAAFALGVFIGFSPTFGLHTISCLLLAWLFRLSKLVVFTGALINNPWTVVPLYGFCLWFGLKITGADIAAPVIAWNELTFRNAYEVLMPYLWPFVAGTVIIGAVAAGVAYVVIYWAVIRYRKREREISALS